MLIWKWTRALLNLILSQGKFRAQLLSFSITKFFHREEFVLLFANVVEHCRFEFFHRQLYFICFESVSFRNDQDRNKGGWQNSCQISARLLPKKPFSKVASWVVINLYLFVIIVNTFNIVLQTFSFQVCKQLLKI